MIEFTKYAKIKDHYCICYFGPSDEYLVQLKLIKPVIEAKFPGLKIHFGCRDDKVHIFGDMTNVLKATELRTRRHDFAHIRELRYNGHTHPVEDFLIESGINDWNAGIPIANERPNKCVIVTSGSYPTRPLIPEQIQALTRIGKEKGYVVEIDKDASVAGLVMGVESLSLFQAAARGMETVLVPTGVGTRLYKQLFPNQSLLHI